MTIIAATGGFGVDQVPIEEIDPGETVLTHLDRSPTTFVVEIKHFNIDKAAATVQAPVSTLTNRIIAAPPEEQSSAI